MADSNHARRVQLALQEVSLKLGEGDLNAASLAAQRYLDLVGSRASVAVPPLVTLDALADESSVTVVARTDDDSVPSTARVGSGLIQHARWSQAYQPPPLRLFLLRFCEVVFPNVLMTAEDKIVDDNIGYTNSELCAHLSPGFPGVAASQSHIVLAEQNRETVFIDEPSIYLPVSENYAVWLFGSLPRLAAFSRRPELAQLPIVLHGEVKSFHLKSLATLGVPSERLITHGSRVRLKFQKLYYCSSSYLHHAPSLTGVRYVGDGVLRTLGDVASPKRLYLARRKVTDRSILNESEVVSLFERNGFTAIDPEEHSFETQASLASRADIIAGPYGANLANLMFAGRAKKCLIVATKPQPEFARLSSAMGIASWHVVPDAVKLRNGRTFSESYGFVASIDLTRAVLDVCLGADV
jgi:hypothetical protein